MHDPKFEKEVQQKMGELEFTPPEAVWLRVDAAINKPDRRRIPVFWIYLLSSAALFGGVILATHFYHSGADKQLHASRNSHPVDDPADVKNLAGDNGQGRAVVTNPSARLAVPSVQGETAGRPGIDAAGTNSVVSTASGTTNPGESASPFVRSTNHHSEKPNRKGSELTGDNIAGENAVAVSGNTGSAANNESAAAKTGHIVPISGARGDVTALFRSSATTSSLVSQSNKKSIQKIKTRSRRSWEAGFAGGIGSSSMNQTLFRKASVNALDLRPSSGTSPAALPIATNDKIQPDISYWAGIVVQKELTARLTFATGLNLHYSSTRMRTGQQVVNALGASLSSSYTYISINSPAAAPQPQAPYYPAGNEQTYINKYYFLDIPVSIQFQLNKSRKLPLFLEGGLSLSYLMSSDALYYNVTDGVYYKDGAMTNKAQLNASTALLVGIPIQGIRVQAGPQLQYGISRVLDEVTPGDGHMFFAGLKVAVLPGGRHKR